MNGLGVIFDMDGVLVDSYRAHLESWQQVAREHGLEITEADFSRTFGRTSREIIGQLWPGRFDDEQIRQFDTRKEAAYRDSLRRHFPAMDGAAELIAALHAAGFRLAIGSSGPVENVEVVRQMIGNGGLISATVNGGQVKRGKPDPEVFLLAAGKIGLEPARCAVVEDALVGLRAARSAGMTAIGLTGTAPRAALEEQAHWVVDSLREITPERVAEMIGAEGQRMTNDEARMTNQ